MCMGVYVFVCIRVYVRVSSLVGLCVVAFGPVWWDPNPLQETRIRGRRWPDTLAIWRPTYEMIRRSVPALAVKTRWRFGSKTVLFYVNICSHVVSLLLLPVGVYVSVRTTSWDMTSIYFYISFNYHYLLLIIIIFWYC